jgi:deoxyribodipyrimidine photo-lyase
MNTPTLFWHRRDLRIDDNAGLYKALKSGGKVQAIFIFDKNILEKLPKNDQRVLFIHQEVERLKKEYQDLGSDLKVYFGKPLEIIPKLVEENGISKVYTNRDYEPYALERDSLMFEKLKVLNCEFIGAKDHVIFEKNEVLKDDGLPYTIFTPYSRKWKAKLNDFYLSSYPTKKFVSSLQHSALEELIPLQEMGFDNQQLFPFPERIPNDEIINKYALQRDIPSIKGTSKLSVHLRFGTISIRQLARKAATLNETYLNELIWRDFYQMIVFHFPHSVHNSFKKQYDKIVWEKDEANFKVWCEGKTGYPLVDAGMRELNQTGFMHNRVRMVVASFLTKHLLIDWRLGETYFAEKLMDFDLGSNVGGWQWAASSGCDAAPYFRVFNPSAQQEKFDKQFAYIKKWVPEFGTSSYPAPIVDHKFARERVLNRFKEALSEE